MSRNRWILDDSSTFDEPIQVPTGIDDAYMLRFSPPVLILCSGKKFVSSYRDFVFRLLPNTHSAYTYYTQTNRFLNFVFYCLKIHQIDGIEHLHIQKYMKNYLGKPSDYGDSSVFSAIRMMFGKFRHDGLICDIPYPSAEDTIGHIRANKPRKSRPKKQPFQRYPEHETYDLLDKVLDDPESSDILDFRANAIVAILLYLDFKVGELVKLKTKDFFINDLGQEHIIYCKADDKQVLRICSKSARHLVLYLDQFDESDPEDPLFQQLTRSLLPTGRPFVAQTASNIVHRFCKRNMIEKFSSREITKARRYVSVKEFNKSFSYN